MGATLGKSKSLSISGKANGHDNQAITISNQHIDGTTTLEKKIKKKKERISHKKSSDLKVDKYTSTDGSVIRSSSSSSYIQQLVAGSGCDNLSYDAQVYLINHSEIPSRDVLELRDACIRRGIISPETNPVTLPISIEQDQQENTIEESTNEMTTTTTVVTNNEPVQNEEQIES